MSSIIQIELSKIERKKLRDRERQRKRRLDNPEEYKRITKIQNTRYYRLNREEAKDKARKYRSDHPEAIKEAQKKSREKNKVKNNEYRRKESAELKRKVLDEYGGICVCCGEKNTSFLTIDHSNNDGKIHRKENSVSGNYLYRWLKKHSYPKNLGLRVLCFNCNCGRQVNKGTCPHISIGVDIGWEKEL